MSSFDFGKLVNALTNNNQAHLPPNDVFRMGEVVGYDPHYAGDSHSYPMLSIQLAGDETPMHGFRFAESYVPNIGDTVFVLLSGEDGWVIAALAGAEKDNGVGQLRSPSSIIGVISSRNESIINVGSPSGPVAPQPFSPAVKFTSPYLPNRIYRIEGTVSFSVTNVATGGGHISGGGSSSSTATITSTGSYPSGTGSGVPHAISFIGHWDYDTPDAQKLFIDIGDKVGLKSLYDLAGDAIIVGPNLEENHITYITGANTGTNPYVTISNEIAGGTAGGATMHARDVPTGMFGDYPSATGSTPVAVPFTYTVLNNRTSATGPVTFPGVDEGTFSASTDYSEVALAVKSPNTGGIGDIWLEMSRLDVTDMAGETVSLNGFTTYWYTPTGPLASGSWEQTFDWELYLQPISNSTGHYPVIHNLTQHFIVYDCGVAS